MIRTVYRLCIYYLHLTLQITSLHNNMEIVSQYLRKQYKKPKSNGCYLILVYKCITIYRQLGSMFARISMVILMSLKCD